MATEAQIYAFCLLLFPFSLIPFPFCEAGIFTLVKSPLQITPFYAKQTQFAESPNECKLIYNKGLQKKRRFRSPKKQTQFKPNTNPIKPNQSQNKANMNPKQTQYEPKQSQFQTGHLLVNRAKTKLLNFHLRNSLTVWLNSVKYRFLCSERECFYEELYGKEKSGRA